MHDLDFWKSVHEKIMILSQESSVRDLSELMEFSQIQNHTLLYYLIKQVEKLQKDLKELQERLGIGSVD